MLQREKKFGLTSKEVEVLQLLSEGNAEKRAAGLLGKSLRTVQSQTLSAKRKMLASTVALSVAIGIREGVILHFGAQPRLERCIGEPRWLATHLER